MPEVPEYLVPRDGLTNSTIRFAGLKTLDGRGGAELRFDITDEDQLVIGRFEFEVPPQPEGTVDAVIAAGYRHMTDVVRQWLYVLDQVRPAYEPKSDRNDEP